MRLSQQGSVVAVDGVSGALAHGQWRFDTHQFPWGEACLYGVGRFDPGETSSLLRSVIGDDAFFSHGLVAGMQIMVVRSIRTRVLRRAQEEREAAIAATRRAQAGRVASAPPPADPPAAATPRPPILGPHDLTRLIVRPLRPQLRRPAAR